MIRILNKPNQDLVQASSLDIGQSFYYKNIVYIKIASFSAIDITKVGKIDPVYFPETAPVLKVDLELKVIITKEYKHCD